MINNLRILASFQIILLAFATSAFALTTEQGCLVEKSKAIGKFSQCLLKVEAKLQNSSAQQKYTLGIRHCNKKFANSWQKILDNTARKNSSCYDRLLTKDHYKTFVSMLTEEIAEMLGKGQVLSNKGKICSAKKYLTAGKYIKCAQNAKANLVSASEASKIRKYNNQLANCKQNFSSSWWRITVAGTNQCYDKELTSDDYLDLIDENIDELIVALTAGRGDPSPSPSPSITPTDSSASPTTSLPPEQDTELINFQSFFTKIPNSNGADLTVVHPLDSSKLVGRNFIYGICKPNSTITMQIRNLSTQSTICQNGKYFFDLKDLTQGSNKVVLTQDPNTEQAQLLTRKYYHQTIQSRYSGQALVVYNTNAVHAEDIAFYYVAKRGLPVSSLCPVRTITGNYADKKDVLGLRSQILKNCILPLLPVNVDASDLEAIRQYSPVTHLILVKGIPYFMTGTEWAGSQYDIPVLGTYLSHLIYKDPLLVLNTANNGTELTPRYNLASSNIYMQRELNPESDQMVAWGNLEGFDYESTKKIIDRTVSAEQEGLHGQFITEYIVNTATPAEKNNLGNFLLTVVNDDRERCIRYLQNNTRLNPHDCRTVASLDVIPAYTSTIEHPINASIFLGPNPMPNDQIGFNGSFDKLLGWRKTANACTPLCKDLPLAQLASCRQRSLDYFKQINSDCVGVAKGFIGHQVRSYPVTFFGVMPNGWDIEGGPGPSSNPKIIATGGFVGVNPSKTRFLRFGGNSIDTSLTCLDEQDTEYPCHEKVRVSLMKEDKIPGNLSIESFNSVLRLQSKFYYRFPSESGVVRICMFYDFLDRVGRALRRVSDNGAYSANQACRDITSNGQWQQVDFGEFSFNGAKFLEGTTENYVDIVRSWIRIGLNQSPRGEFDIDEYEITRTDTNQNLVDRDISGFEVEDMSQLTAGDYAANVLERLGGIGWWGSSSHFKTGGWAWSNSSKFILNLINGGSLGEAIYTAGGAPSGLIFADPLYHPSAISLRIGHNHSLAGQNYYQDPKTPGQFYTQVTQENIGTEDPFVVRAVHGTKSTKGFTILSCAMPSVHDCNTSNGWSSVYEQAGPAYNKQIYITSENLNLDPTIEHNIIFMLKVENTNPQILPLYSVFEVKLMPNLVQ